MTDAQARSTDQREHGHEQPVTDDHRRRRETCSSRPDCAVMVGRYRFGGSPVLERLGPDPAAQDTNRHRPDQRDRHQIDRPDREVGETNKQPTGQRFDDRGGIAHKPTGDVVPDRDDSTECEIQQIADNEVRGHGDKIRPKRTA